MRLAIVRQRYTPFGGAERFIENALEALLERNVAITLYTREWPDTNVKLMEPQIVDPFYLGRLWRDWGFARSVCRKIKRARPELVQSHERLRCCDVFRAGDGVHAVWLEERNKGRGALARLSVTLSPYHRYTLRRERALFANPALAAVICNSTMVRDEIKARFGIADAKLRVVYNAVDTEVFSPALRAHRAAVRQHHGIADDTLVFLLVGSGYERKGVIPAIDALAELATPAHLVIVGRESRMTPYARHARERGVLPRVTFAGPQADPKPYFGAADAFVLPTLYDPLPNAALEAMACALPVVTSTKSGVAEMVVRAGAGFVCDSRDIAALVAHMRSLEDGALRDRMGEHARNAVLPLSPAAMTLELVLLYKDLLEASVARREAMKSARGKAATRPATAPAAGTQDAVQDSAGRRDAS